MTKRINKGVNQTLETWLTRGTPFLELKTSKGVSIAPPFPIAVCESFEISQTSNSVTLSSPSEETVDVVRRANISKELTGTFVARDFKPQMITLITGGTMYSDAEQLVTTSYTVRDINEYIILDGFQKYVGFSAEVDSVALVEDTDFSMSDGLIQLMGTLEVGDVINLEYTRKARVRIEASTKDEVYGSITFIGHRVTESENNLYKVTVRLAQFDTSTYSVQSSTDFASDTVTFTLLASGSGSGLSRYYSTELATEEV